MLLGLFAFLLPSCSTNLRGPSKNSTISKGSGSSSESRLRKDMVDYARQFNGAKYKYGGNGPGSFDCSGLTCLVYKKFSIAIPRTSSTQANLGKKIPVERAKPGDLAFFTKGSRGGKINHVALVIANDRDGLKVIHSTTSRGVVIDNVNHSSYWKPRLLYVKDVIGN